MFAVAGPSLAVVVVGLARVVDEDVFLVHGALDEADGSVEELVEVFAQQNLALLLVSQLWRCRRTNNSELLLRFTHAHCLMPLTRCRLLLLHLVLARLSRLHQFWFGHSSWRVHSCGCLSDCSVHRIPLVVYINICQR